MLFGLFLILFGVLVLVRPEVVRALIAAVCISTGLVISLMGWRWRRLRKTSRAQWVNWLIRW